MKGLVEKDIKWKMWINVLYIMIKHVSNYYEIIPCDY